MNTGGFPEAIAVAYEGYIYAIGTYNWSDAPKNVTVSLQNLHIPLSAGYNARLDSYGSEQINLNDDILTVFNQPGESLRIIRLDKTG